VTLGSEQTSRWLEQRGLDASGYEHWFVEIRLAATGDEPATLGLNIYPAEWGLVVRHGASMSAIRVTDKPFVHDRDDLGLADRVRSLDDIGSVVSHVEVTRFLRFSRYQAHVRSNFIRATSVVRTWLNTL
jgi:hypothetical protein